MFRVQTNHPVALESYDHIYPFGTIRDNNSNSELIKKLKELGIRTVLDIGCAGGLFVEELLRNNINAIGIEGSDINLKTQRASWVNIPNNLFTADATHPFQIYYKDSKCVFDVITAWEFFEHIEEQDLRYVMENIVAHSHKDTQLLCSVSNFDSPHEEIDLHRTKKECGFWLELFAAHGFFEAEYLYRHYVGNYVRYGSFNLVLQRNV